MFKLWRSRKFKDDQKEQDLLEILDKENLPGHVAIIMDGNGRWAKQRGLPRVVGHRAGMESVREIVKLCAELKLPVLTLYAFSTENWKRPREEVDALMNLLVEYLHREIEELVQNDVRVRHIGRAAELPPPALEALTIAMEKTCKNEGLVLNLALNYGGRTEIVDAMREIAAKVKEGELTVSSIDESTIDKYLYTAGLPDPDLLIRTSGDCRISNFLLWQLAYTEFWLTPVMWPDFRRKHFLTALVEFQQRERRFGGIRY
ncbi:MAG: isoprenyl transferase [Peptococcaceae bacterium]|nr:MAG: isoprenyl transferase [Peptococcaceae bacterium]